MRVLTYDNPMTMRRECWQDGTIIWSCDYALFFMGPFPIPPDQFFFGANTGSWTPGQMWGDPEAMTAHLEESCLALQSLPGSLPSSDGPSSPSPPCG